MSLCILLADPKKKCPLQENVCSKGNHHQAKAYANVTQEGAQASTRAGSKLGTLATQFCLNQGHSK